MSNFIGLVFATLKNEGIDTSGMSTDEAIKKYNELQEKSGGKSGEKEPTPAENRRMGVHKDWSGVNTIRQAKKLDEEIVEKKLATNLLTRYGDTKMSAEEIAEQVENFGKVDLPYDKEKVKEFVINNYDKRNKIFGSFREISEQIQ